VIKHYVLKEKVPINFVEFTGDIDKIAGTYWMKRHDGKGKAHAFPGKFARNQAVCGQVISDESWDVRINADGSIYGPALINAAKCGACRRHLQERK